MLQPGQCWIVRGVRCVFKDEGGNSLWGVLYLNAGNALGQKTVRLWNHSKENFVRQSRITRRWPMQVPGGPYTYCRNVGLCCVISWHFYVYQKLFEWITSACILSPACSQPFSMTPKCCPCQQTPGFKYGSQEEVGDLLLQSLVYTMNPEVLSCKHFWVKAVKIPAWQVGNMQLVFFFLSASNIGRWGIRIFINSTYFYIVTYGYFSFLVTKMK